MRAKEEVEKWLNKHIINDATVVAVDKWLSIHGYDDMEFSIGDKGDVTFMDLFNFCNYEDVESVTLESIHDQVITALRILKTAINDINNLREKNDNSNISDKRRNPKDDLKG